MRIIVIESVIYAVKQTFKCMEVLKFQHHVLVCFYKVKIKQ
jgi:hypothetical protein